MVPLLQITYLLFSQIDLVEQPFDREKNIKKGFCFITFETGDPVEVICASQKHHVGSRDVRPLLSFLLSVMYFMLLFVQKFFSSLLQFLTYLCRGSYVLMSVYLRKMFPVSCRLMKLHY